MSFAAILDGIHHFAQRQIAEINKNAAVQIKVIESEEKAELEKIKAEALVEGQSRIAKKKALLVQQTRMKSLQKIADARQKLIEMVIDQLQKELDGFRADSMYSGVLASLIEQAVIALEPSLLPGQRIILQFDHRDRASVPPSYLTDPRYLPEFELNSNGGCNAVSEDGLVRVLNTLEDRFLRALPGLQTQLSVFFDSKCRS
jgi:vacuolar-type H+-ATPase subunit E/Vma4